MLFRNIKWENRFKSNSIPWFTKLFKISHKPTERIRHKLSQIPLQKLFYLIYKQGIKGQGNFTINVKGENRLLNYNARNFQFQAIYMPQYLEGYEIGTSALLDLIVGENDVFYDIGSNWGYYSLFLASIKEYKGKVYAFEPMPSTFNDLKDLVNQAGLDRQIECLNIGLSDNDGEGNMIMPDGYSSGLATLSSEGGGVKVSIKKLDNIDIKLPDVIKMDVEDHEIKTLKGAAKTLDKAKPMLVLENWKKRNDPQITLVPLKLLADMGYILFNIGWHSRINDINYIDNEVSFDKDLKANLALTPFKYENRFFLETWLNIFACHKDKLPALQKIFDAP